jgi:hypothetical protein
VQQLAPWAVCALALGLAASLVLTHPVMTWRTGADEGTYLGYAVQIARDGPGAIPALTRAHLDDPSSRANAPSPLRLAVVLPDAFAVWLLGPDYPSLQRVSLAALLALIFVAFVGFRHVAGPRIAMAVTLLLAVSPLQLGMARRALGDNLSTALWTASIFLCVEALASEWRRGWLAVAVAFALTLLVKEANLILVPIALVLVMFDAIRRGRAPSWLAVVGTTLAPVTLAGLAMAFAAGGARTAFDCVVATLHQTGENPYLLRFGGGPWYRYVVDFLLLSPWTALLYLVWLGILVGTQRMEDRLIAWALLPILYLAAVSPVARFVRWTMPLDVPIRLGAALAIAGLLGGRAMLLPRAMVLGLLMVADIRSFLALFVVGDIYDPSNWLLLWWRGFLPP